MPTRRPPKGGPHCSPQQAERLRRERLMRVAAPYMLETLRTVQEKLRAGKRDADLLRIIQQTLMLAEGEDRGVSDRPLPGDKFDVR